jgi:hypothetical protein
MVGSGALEWLVLLDRNGNVTSVLVLGVHTPATPHTHGHNPDRTNRTQHGWNGKTWKEKKEQLRLIMAMLARVPSISLYNQSVGR